MALISCPECGKQMSDRAPACPHCGASASAGSAAEKRKCGECGAVLPDGAAACPVCGCPVEAEPAQLTYTAPPVLSAPASGEEQFENVLAKGKKSPVGRIVCSVLAGLLWIACAALIGCVIYDYNFAASVGGFYYYGDTPEYYSSLAGGWYIEQYWLIIGLAAAAVLAVAGAAVFIAGFGKRVRVTNARIVIKHPFKPTVGLTWDRVEMAAEETDKSFVVKSGDKKYHIANLLNQDEVFAAVNDMLSRKSSGTLKMPAVYGVKSTFGKLFRKKALVITAAGVVVAGIAAAVLTPVIMGLCAQQVTNVAYEWNVKELKTYGSFGDGESKVIEIPITGCYSGGWLNGKPYGTGTFLSDSGNDIWFGAGSTFTGTWKNGEPCKGTVVDKYYSDDKGTFDLEVYSGGFIHSRTHGQCKAMVSYYEFGEVWEGEMKYGIFYNGAITSPNGEIVATFKNGEHVD